MNDKSACNTDDLERAGAMRACNVGDIHCEFNLGPKKRLHSHVLMCNSLSLSCMCFIDVLNPRLNLLLSDGNSTCQQLSDHPGTTSDVKEEHVLVASLLSRAMKSK